MASQPLSYRRVCILLAGKPTMVRPLYGALSATLACYGVLDRRDGSILRRERNLAEAYAHAVRIGRNLTTES
jgi:hypothetical protein